MLTRARRAPSPTGTSARRRPPLWRHPLLLVAFTVALVAVAVVAAYGNAHPKPSSRASSSAAAAKPKDTRTVLDAATRLDPKVVAAVGDGGRQQSAFTPLSGAPALTGPNGRPEVFFVGSEDCATCAAERWGLVIALSRFGSFGRLYLTQSASGVAFPDTATFTFRNATYASHYVDLVAVETADRTGAALSAPTADEQGLIARFDAPPYVPAAGAGSTPWIDVANRYATQGAGFTPAVLGGLSWADVVEKLGNAADPVTRGIVGTAGDITAAICRATGMQPASVCGAPPISQLAGALP